MVAKKNRIWDNMNFYVLCSPREGLMILPRCLASVYLILEGRRRLGMGMGMGMDGYGWVWVWMGVGMGMGCM